MAGFDDDDAIESEDEGFAACENPTFSSHAISPERLAAATDGKNLAGAASSNGSLLLPLQSGGLLRWYPDDDDMTHIDFGKDRVGDISRVMMDPMGFHAIICNNMGDSWYLNFSSKQAKSLQKLKGMSVECVSWDPQASDSKTGDLVMGTMEGLLLKLDIEGKERQVKQLFAFQMGEFHRLAICGVQRERIHSAEGERLALFVAAGCGIYVFVEKALDSLFTRFQGEGAYHRAMVYEVPRDSPHGELHIDDVCVGSGKVLFWLTGVGVLAAAMKSPEADNQVLEAPPGLIPFPRSSKDRPFERGADTLVASLLPPPPPPAPRSIALTRFYVIMMFDSRWAAVSRVTHECAFQQEWATTMYGNLKALRRDFHGEKLIMVSEKQVFEIRIENDDSNVWALLCKQEDFESAFNACYSDAQKQIVLSKHADWLFKQKRLKESARMYAKSSVPFEHVALRFLQRDRKPALIEYIRCRLRLCGTDDNVTRALLGVWAIELSLSHLNDLQLQAKDKPSRRLALETILEKSRVRFQDLLMDCRTFDVARTICHLLQSYGWLEELVMFAEGRKDYDTVIIHHVMRRNFAGAIQKLGEIHRSGPGERLSYHFAPVLFGCDPHAFVSLMLRLQLEPLSLLPSVYAPRSSLSHRSEAIRYLTHVARHHPELARMEDILPFARHQRGEGDAEDVERSSGWSTGTSVLNALVALYALSEGIPFGGEDAGQRESELGTAEDFAMRFFQQQDGSTKFDPHFALRISMERGLLRAAVFLCSRLGLYEEAVDMALQSGDVALAKLSAAKHEDHRLRRRLWLRVVESQASSSMNFQEILEIIRESQAAAGDPNKELTIHDVVSYLHDTMPLKELQPEIASYLEDYDARTTSLRQEMDDHKASLLSFKDDVGLHRSVIVEVGQRCEFCSNPAADEEFFVFPCSHCFHEACLEALIMPNLDSERCEAFFALKSQLVEHQAAINGTSDGTPLPECSLADLKEQLDTILADDCPLCGRFMIRNIKRSFVDQAEDDEIESWLLT